MEWITQLIIDLYQGHVIKDTKDLVILLLVISSGFLAYLVVYLNRRIVAKDSKIDECLDNALNSNQTLIDLVSALKEIITEK